MPRQHYQLNIPLHEALLVLCTREPKHHAPSQIGTHNPEECAASIFRTEERWSHHIPPEHLYLSTSIPNIPANSSLHSTTARISDLSYYEYIIHN
jgi:hypothetical protein